MMSLAGDELGSRGMVFSSWNYKSKPKRTAVTKTILRRGISFLLCCRNVGSTLCGTRQHRL